MPIRPTWDEWTDAWQMDEPITIYERYAQNPTMGLRVYRSLCLTWLRLSQVFRHASTTLFANFAVNKAVGVTCAICVQFARRLIAQRAI